MDPSWKMPTRAERSGAAAGSKPAPGLYIVSTPIGNLRDITLRALDTLGGADLVACEDSRVTGRLLAAYGIAAQTVAYHDHNAAKIRPRLLAALSQGSVVALVSDAGTPLVSDPGYKLVREASAAGHAVIGVPGPSAPLAALVTSGLPSDRFLFAGFLPSRAAARKAAIADLGLVPATLVLFESARRLPAALAALAAGLGPRPAAVARELTKLFEEVRRDTLDQLAAHYAQAGPPKGEVVIVVGPPDTRTAATDEASLDGQLADALREMSVRDAAAAVAAATGLQRRVVYARALALAKAARR